MTKHSTKIDVDVIRLDAAIEEYRAQQRPLVEHAGLLTAALVGNALFWIVLLSWATS